MRRTVAAAALTLAGMLAPAVASADEFEGTRSDRLVERAHEIDITVDRGYATLRARRTVFNGGERHDQATFWIDVPEHSVATSLRTLGTHRGKPKWFDGELMEAEAAAEKYQELTGIGGYYPKDPALLSWRSQEQLALQVFPCPPNERKTVEYTLSLPSEYEDGRYRFSLERLGTRSFAAELVLRTADPRDQLYVDGEAMDSGTRLDGDRAYEIGLGPDDAPQVGSELAVVATGDRYLVRYELALASELSSIPANAGVVVVLDTSVSMDESAVQAQLAATRAYLGHFADPRLRARAEVITFDREVHPMHGRLRSVSKVLADLEGMSPTQRNGSHLDLALRRATELLDASRVDHRRIVILSDTMMREALTTPEVVQASRDTKALVHVGLVDDSGGASMVRHDGHPWSEAARATGGLLWDADASTSVTDAREMSEVYLEWARPVRVHDPAILSPGADEDAFDLPGSLPEGFGYATTQLQDDRVRHVVLSGELWATPLLDVAKPDEDFGTRWSALVFGSELESELTEPEMMVLAMRGGAVSPVTSYLAIEPGVRPSTEGLDWGAIGAGGAGGIGSGFGSGSRRGYGVRRSTFDPQAFLATQVRRAGDRCGVPKHVNIDVGLQTTVDEIVEVERVDFVGYLDTKLKACVREEVWSIVLPGNFSRPWARWAVRG